MTEAGVRSLGMEQMRDLWLGWARRILLLLLLLKMVLLLVK
jgi:hypothetical protein